MPRKLTEPQLSPSLPQNELNNHVEASFTRHKDELFNHWLKPSAAAAVTTISYPSCVSSICGDVIDDSSNMSTIVVSVNNTDNRTSATTRKRSREAVLSFSVQQEDEQMAESITPEDYTGTDDIIWMNSASQQKRRRLSNIRLSTLVLPHMLPSRREEYRRFSTTVTTGTAAIEDEEDERIQQEEAKLSILNQEYEIEKQVWNSGCCPQFSMTDVQELEQELMQIC